MIERTRCSCSTQHGFLCFTMLRMFETPRGLGYTEAEHTISPDCLDLYTLTSNTLGQARTILASWLWEGLLRWTTSLPLSISSFRSLSKRDSKDEASPAHTSFIFYFIVFYRQVCQAGIKLAMKLKLTLNF